MRTMLPPLEEILSFFLRICTVKRHSGVRAGARTLIIAFRGAQIIMILCEKRDGCVNRKPDVCALMYCAYVKDDKLHSLLLQGYLSTVVHRICMETIRERDITIVSRSRRTYDQRIHTFVYTRCS